MKRCKCGTFMNWYSDYCGGMFVSGYVCPACGYDTRNEQYTTSDHTEPLVESEAKIELLTVEVKTFLCPICGEKMRVLAPFVPDEYIRCHKCGHEMPTSPESEVKDELRDAIWQILSRK